jgi:ribonuclease P protein component
VLPASRRLRRPAQFRAVRSGRRAGTSTLVVQLAGAPSGSGSCDELAAAVARAGFVVGRRVGPAVIRNRVRRRLRHLVASRIDRLPAGALLLVRALPPAAAAPSSQLGDDLDRALDRLLAAGRDRRSAQC